MATKRHERTLARRQAVQLLYQSEILGVSPLTLMDSADAYIDDAKPSEYALRLVRGTAEQLPTVDAQIKASSENWAMDRMPTVDRAVLRLACYEMVFVDEVPVSVAINEAVDLARDFGGEDESPKFVNGVLGRIATMLENGELAPVAAAADKAGEQAADASAQDAEQAPGAGEPDAAPAAGPDAGAAADFAADAAADEPQAPVAETATDDAADAR